MSNVDELTSCALANFRAPPLRYNCCQTVLNALGRDPAAGAALGAGRAEDNRCGALEALVIAAGDDAVKRQCVIDGFKNETGYIRCRELKGEGKVPCERCVSCACAVAARELF